MLCWRRLDCSRSWWKCRNSLSVEQALISALSQEQRGSGRKLLGSGKAGRLSGHFQRVGGDAIAWQPDDEAGSLARRALDLNFAAVRFDDPRHETQTESQ